MQQYLDLIQHILDEGIERGDRTGVGTISVFGTQTRYNLRQGFPLLTTKKVNHKALIHELLWFLKGSTNIKDLNTKIWSDWADEDGELGPIYGFQWRNWGAQKVQLGRRAKPHLGIDQIQNAIDMIKNDPESRRIIVSAWNVTDLPAMALPPCHLMFQFYVRRGTFLDCMMTQRSADMALGVPFNIASYALLTHMIAKECGLVAGHFIHNIGDAHIYLNHVEGLKEQLTRRVIDHPRAQLEIADKPLDEIEFDDIKITGYEHHPPIRFEIAV